MTELAELDRLAALYAEHAPNVPDPHSLVYDALEGFPHGACGVVTVLLRDLLGGEVVKGFYGGLMHTFLELPALGVIVDVTADQFGGPCVYVGPITEPWSRERKQHD